MLDLEPTTSTYLGPARVMAATPGKAHLRLHDQELWAQVALAFPYQLTPGDSVLVIGQDEAWYVIGVLRGSGKTCWSVPADLFPKRGSVSWYTKVVQLDLEARGQLCRVPGQTPQRLLRPARAGHGSRT